MRILLINASPRRQGNLSKMLDAMRVEIESAGVEAIEVKTADLCVKPCTGCMVCRRSLQCVLPDDDAQRVLELMNGAMQWLSEHLAIGEISREN